MYMYNVHVHVYMYMYMYVLCGWPRELWFLIFFMNINKNA